MNSRKNDKKLKKEKVVEIKKIGKFLIFLILPFVLYSQGKISISANVDKSSLVLGDYLEYRIEISGTSRFNSNNIQLPSIPNFQRMNNAAHTSRSTSIVNGRMSEKTILTYYLKPQKVGRLIIPNFKLKIDNVEYNLNAIPISVNKSASNAKEVKYVFIKQTVNTTKPYQYQEITVKYLLYVHPQVGVDNISLANSPSNTGVWKESYDNDNAQQLPSENVDGLQYKVYLISKEAMFPTIAGPLTINAPEFKVSINRIDRHNSSRRNSIFELFGSSRVRENLTIKSNEYKIDVQEIKAPDGKDIDFAGNLKLDVDVSKTVVETNDAINLTITLTGTGNIQSLDLSDFYISPDIEKYEPNLRTKINKDGNRINGFKKIEYALVPRVAGSHKIGPFEYSYWDISKNKAVTLRKEAIEIKVDQGKSFVSANTGGSVAAKRDVARLDEDIRYIRDISDSFSDISYIVTDSYSYYTYYLFVLIVFFIASFFMKQRMKLDSNLDLKRQKQASAKAEKFLKQAAALKDENHHNEYFSSIKKLLLNYIADKTNTDWAGYTTNSLHEILSEKNVDELTISEISELIEKCDFYQYSNPSDINAEMDVIYNKASDLYLKISKVI